MLIINKNLSYYTIDGTTCEEWLVNLNNTIPEDVRYILDDDNPLKDKILKNPYFKTIENSSGELIDITPLKPPKYVPTIDEQIQTIQQQLTNTDYQAIKYAEGWLTDDEYEPIRLQRQRWRDEINTLKIQIESEVK